MSLAILPSLSGLDFELPHDLEAAEPPEARGLSRDQVRLMVSYRDTDRVEHNRFQNLPDFLNSGDVLLINTSGTLNAALLVNLPDGSPAELHLSTRLPAELWIVEVRQPFGSSTRPFPHARAGWVLELPGGGVAHLLTPYLAQNRLPGNIESQNRLWIATLVLPQDLHSYLEQYGFPIKYSYVKQEWPITYYQTVYSTEPGSAEMPSAGRAFTPELLTRLVAKGVQVAPLLLHTGVASLEDHEPPYEEYYRVPAATARLVNSARAEGRRVVAVGTTSVRAIETVTDESGVAHPGEGWTRLVIGPERRMRAVNALLTGFHEPKATHLAMLEALSGRQHLEIAYAEALAQKYLWHEFGDLHLIL
jgi:S-adenosylmethionine:tRNA ribosyltransferase-isomerase